MGITDSKFGPPSDAIVSLRKQYDALSHADRFQFRITLDRDHLDLNECMYHILKSNPENEINVSFEEWLMLGKEGVNESYVIAVINKWNQLKPFIKCVVFNKVGVCVCLTHVSESGESNEHPSAKKVESLKDLDKADKSCLVSAKVEHNGNVYCLNKFLSENGKIEASNNRLFNDEYGIRDDGINTFDEWLLEEPEDSEDQDERDDRELEKSCKFLSDSSFKMAKCYRKDLDRETFEIETAELKAQMIRKKADEWQSLLDSLMPAGN